MYDLNGFASDCYNPSQANQDNDLWGDRCDLCPLDSVPQTDSDGDGVGDACDNCDTPNPYEACHGAGKGSCVSPGQGLCRGESPTPGAEPVGLCSGQVDLDGDGIGGECDTCSDIPTPLGEFNSNDIAEESTGAPHLGDVCDRVPVAALKAQEADEVVSGLALQQGDGEGPDDLVAIYGNTWLGRVNWNTPGNPATIDESIKLLHCDCHDDYGNEIPDVHSCVGQAKRCRSLQPVGKLEWRGITLEQPDPLVAIPPNQDTPFTMLFRTFAPPSSQVDQFGFLWHWYDDVQAGRINRHVREPNAPWDATHNPYTTHGAILTHVENGTNTYASTDRDEVLALRDVYGMYDTPLVERTDEANRLDVPWDKFACLFGACIQWALPDIVSNPNPLDLIARFRSPTMVIESGNDVYAVRGATDALRITDFLSPSVKELASQRDEHMWLSPVEAGYRVKRHGLSAQAVVFPVSLAESVSPSVIIARGRSFALWNEERGVGPMASVASTSSATWEEPWGLTRFQGAFSAIERAVYVVGGDIGGRASGAIWRYSLETGMWQRILSSAHAAPSAQVLSVTYDQQHAALYVLDVDDEPMAHGAHAPHRARLTRYDTHSKTSTLLATWPYVGTFRTCHIAVADGGDIVLVAATTSAWTAWRLHVDPDSVRFAGVQAGPGRVLDRPVIGEQDLTLPVVRLRRPEYVTLSASSFHGGAPCSSL